MSEPANTTDTALTSPGAGAEAGDTQQIYLLNTFLSCPSCASTYRVTDCVSRNVRVVTVTILVSPVASVMAAG